MMRINNKLLEIEQHGEGEAMIMVHGLGGTANAWYPQANLLARSFHVIRPDMEGSGRSPAKGKNLWPSRRRGGLAEIWAVLNRPRERGI